MSIKNESIFLVTSIHVIKIEIWNGVRVNGRRLACLTLVSKVSKEGQKRRQFSYAELLIGSLD